MKHPNRTVLVAVSVVCGMLAYKVWFSGDRELYGAQRIAQACPPQDDRTRRRIHSAARFYRELKSTESADWRDMSSEEHMRNVFSSACLEAIAKAVDLDGY